MYGCSTNDSCRAAHKPYKGTNIPPSRCVQKLPNPQPQVVPTVQTAARKPYKLYKLQHRMPYKTSVRLEFVLSESPRPNPRRNSQIMRAGVSHTHTPAFLDTRESPQTRDAGSSVPVKFVGKSRTLGEDLPFYQPSLRFLFAWLLELLAQ